jgi:RNA polymerase sigma factor (sigma-70 family)
MTDSQALLAEYVKNGSEPAFRELVERYVGLVYCTALRLVSGDTHLAEDVSQIVFADLARTARRLSKDALLGGWLHRDTCFVASKIMRGERRRQSRERQAAEMNAVNNTPDAALAEIAPVLDEAINQLGEKDRAAILLQFFEQRDLSSAGQAMGITQNAVQKRVTRALEKLHSLLKHRGVTLSAGALTAALASESVAAAPAGLAVSIGGSALATAAAGGGTALTAVKIMGMTTLQKTLIAVTILAAVGTGLYELRQASALRSQLQSLQQQQAPLAGQIEQLTRERDEANAKLAALGEDKDRVNSSTAELLKLRGEVARLRTDSQRESSTKPTETNDPTVTKVQAWLDRVKLLKRRFEEWPGKKTPELQLLNEQDWLNEVAKSELDSDTACREAMGHLRAAAKDRFAAAVKEALGQFVTANNDEYPSDPSQLKAYLKPPADSLLEGYEIAKPGSVRPPPLNPPGSKSAETWALVEKGNFTPDGA